MKKKYSITAESFIPMVIILYIVALSLALYIYIISNMYNEAEEVTEVTIITTSEEDLPVIRSPLVENSGLVLPRNDIKEETEENYAGVVDGSCDDLQMQEEIIIPRNVWEKPEVEINLDSRENTLSAESIAYFIQENSWFPVTMEKGIILSSENLSNYVEIIMYDNRIVDESAILLRKFNDVNVDILAKFPKGHLEKELYENRFLVVKTGGQDDSINTVYVYDMLSSDYKRAVITKEYNGSVAIYNYNPFRIVCTVNSEEIKEDHLIVDEQGGISLSETGDN